MKVVGVLFEIESLGIFALEEVSCHGKTGKWKGFKVSELTTKGNKHLKCLKIIAQSMILDMRKQFLIPHSTIVWQRKWIVPL